MGGLRSRNKGKTGEQQVVKLLQPAIDEVYRYYQLIPPKLLRNQMQTFGGGFDIVGIDWLALEVKYQENLAINSWWAQTLRQAKPHQTPVLIYRKNRAKWRVVMPGYLTINEQKAVQTPVDIDLESFLLYLQSRLSSDIQTKWQP